jgi:hypothetical protein
VSVKLIGPYTGTVLTVNARSTVLSGDQEDKLDLNSVKDTILCIPEWGPRGQVGSTQDATWSLIYYWL